MSQSGGEGRRAPSNHKGASALSCFCDADAERRLGDLNARARHHTTIGAAFQIDEDDSLIKIN